MTPTTTITRCLSATVALLLTAGCSGGLDNLIPDRRVDYRQSKIQDPLEIPPDLTASTIDDGLLVPEIDPAATANLSDYSSQAGQSTVLRSAVLPQVVGIKVQRDGDRRWLIVDAPAEQVWPKAREFWTSNGFRLKRSDARIGIMETDWAENRADIPKSIIRSVIGTVADFAYSSSTRDKFRVRLEAESSSVTAVYLTHYGAEEVVNSDTVGPRGSSIASWQSRAADPELEAEMLNRLMVYMGAEESRARSQLGAEGTTSAPRAKIVDVDASRKGLLIDQAYNPSWRLVGLALDNSFFTVEEQNRNQGLYTVQFNEDVQPEKKEGFFSNLAFWKSNEVEEGARYKVRLADQGTTTMVVVQNEAGQPDNSAVAKAILDNLLSNIQ